MRKPDYTRDALILFGRLPEPGRVKTRLSPPLSPAQCLAVHEWLLRHALKRLAPLPVARLWQWAGRTDAGHETLLRQARRMGWRLAPQASGDLGARMRHALESALRRYRRVVLVGSDCPGLSPKYIEQALAALDRTPLVLGPAIDGGYVLIGMTRRGLAARGIFEDMPWGTPEVLPLTLSRARLAGLAPARLPPLADVDHDTDLPGSGVPGRLWRQAQPACEG